MPSRKSTKSNSLETQIEEPTPDEQTEALKSEEDVQAPARPRAKRATARRRAESQSATDADGGNGETAVAEESTAETPTRTRRPRGVRGGRAERRPRRLALPVLIADETLLLPHMSIPFPIEDEESAMVIDRAMRMSPRLLLVLTERVVPRPRSDNGADRDLIDIVSDMIASQADPADIAEDGADGATSPRQDGDGASNDFELAEVDEEYELCTVGVIAEVGQYISRPGGEDHVILQGIARGVVEELIQEQPFVAARVRREDDEVKDPPAAEAAMEAVLEQIEHYISMLPNVPEEVLTMVRSVDEPGWLADLIAFSPEFSPEQRQELLEILDPVARLKRLSVVIQKRLNILTLRREIQSEAQAGMDKQQREYYLREQLRAIQKELGEGSAEEMVAKEIREKIETAGMPDEVKAKALVQVERLEQQHPFSPEIGVIRSYLEWLTELPWAVETEDRLELAESAKILEEDHYGLDKVKERIIEYIAVRKLAGDKLRAPILCFVGPPGVGKTSLGRSIARAIGRNYVRMSLGGVRDEAEIRGHRRTYVGAMPGRVIKALRDAKSKNPVIVLDEIDKVGSDAFRGDPSSALLEVLDPEQNATFSDHYLEVPFDLSKVIFITTANLLEPIPAALRDRMEVIEVSGYTEVEKMAIARNFLLPKALESHGLKGEQLHVTDDAVKRLIREYTEESGVRNLEREIGSLCRKVARRFAGDDPPDHITIDATDVNTYLGVPRFEFGLAEEQDEVGVATGAAVTSVGGDLLAIEVMVMEGKGDLTLTGHLGDVMQESARAALSFARARADKLGLEPGYFDRRNIHVHIPAGAIPKDGPSAGITMATALISALSGVKVRKDVAMTGEITLRGKVLPIGGLREKALAAHRGGITTFILPRRNAKDVSELPAVVREGLELVEVDTLDEVLDIAFVRDLGLSDESRSHGTEAPARPVPTKSRHRAPGDREPIPAAVRWPSLA
ncbi:MAG: endopeptidase La [Chloroflexota bacterium]|nr:endopeptidase La [Chloroflexota bacterium]